MIAALIHILLAASGPQGIAEADIGATYAIAEPNALLEMEAAQKGKSVTLADFGDSDAWTATRSRLLPPAQVNRLREIIPFFTLPFDIPDKDGNILYPKGFTFNPLEHLRLPIALLVVREDQLDWALGAAGPGDMIILSGGNALKESVEHKTPIYLLQTELADRLGLEAAPSRVWQEGARLKIEEIAAADLGAASRKEGAR